MSDRLPGAVSRGRPGLQLATVALIGDNEDAVFPGSLPGLARMLKKDQPDPDFPVNESCAAGSRDLSRLIERSLAGDAGAMQAIYERYKRPLFGLAFRFASDHATAEDLLQDIFLKIFSHLGDVKNPETFTAWVHRIALNTCYSHLRSRRGTVGRTVSLSDIEGWVTDPSSGERRYDLRKPLQDAIRTLPEKLRGVFTLHDIQGFKHEEISVMMGWSVGTSKSQLFKARMRLRRCLRPKKSEKGKKP